jgi:ABC-2 type transport system ATP-binding protein
MTTSPALIVNDLCKSFRQRVSGKGFGGTIKAFIKPEMRSVNAVNHLSFTVERGERVAFVGPNGAGKSTTIKILSGILQPTSGKVSVLGFTPSKDRRQMAYRIGTVFGQRSQLWYHLPPEDTFRLLACAYEIEPDTYKKRLSFLTEAFDIAPLLDKPVRQMSLGQRMRCEIVASLLHKPDVLFLDEPTIGLDITARRTIRDLIRDTSDRDGTTVLLTSHDTGDMEQVCSRVIVIDHGSLVIDKPVADLRTTYIRKKIVTLAMQDEAISLKTRAGLQILETAPSRMVLEVDRDLCPIDQVIQDAMAQTLLQDITIEDPPMEEIISAIYRENRERRQA